MSKEIKDMVVDKGKEEVINLAFDGLKSVCVGNEEHKKRIKDRDEDEKQLEEDLKKARKDLANLYEKNNKSPEIDLSDDISRAKEFYDYKKEMYDDHVQETINLNKKEASDPDRNSRDTIIGMGVSGALCGTFGAAMYHYLKDGAKNFKK